MRKALVLALLVVSTPASAKEPARTQTKKRPPRDYAWCSGEVEALSSDTCYLDGRQGRRDGKRTLVIFLHGAIGKHTDWSWTQEKALLRQAKASHFEAIFPRGAENPIGYAWPGGAEAQAKYEDELLAGWKRAQDQLETKSGSRFDEVFVMGFSSGAYYVSSLALRGRLNPRGTASTPGVDGYAVFAGGAIAHRPSANAPRLPVYVGICGADRQTAAHSRGFAGELATRKFPVRAEEHHVGHMFSDPHVARAVAFLREQTKDKPPAPPLVD